jgi:YidC/Oxa1 family membrane protein insertase
MDQQKRLFLSLGIVVALSYVFTNFIWKPKLDAEQAEIAAQMDAGRASNLPLAASNTGSLERAVDAGVTASAAQPTPAIEARTFPRLTKETHFLFSNVGASLENAVLQGDREREPPRLSVWEGLQTLVGKRFPKPPLMDVAESSPAFAPPLSVSFSGGASIDARGVYEMTDETADGFGFVLTQGPLKVTKKYSLAPSGHFHELSVAVQNVGAAAVTGDLTLHLTRNITPENEIKPSMLGDVGNEASVLCHSAGSLERNRPDDDKPPKDYTGLTQYVGIDQQYFLASAWPLSGPTAAKCTLLATSTVRRADLTLPMTIAPGETVTQKYGLFLGPKDFEELKTAGTPGAFRPELDKTIDFGAFAVICKVLVFLLRTFHSFVGNWGVAIILLTLTVKVLLVPLTHKAMVSAEKMKNMQLVLKPELDEINKKYAEDPQAKQQKTMELYQKKGINPLENLGGCLPMFLQLPIWFALNTTLRTSYELYGEPFVGPLWQDLTSRDPSYLLPLAFGVSQIITLRLSPPMTTEKSQAFLFQWVMPIVFTVTMMRFPAGLTLYILTNNLLSIVQQFFLKRWMARNPVAMPVVQGGTR